MQYMKKELLVILRPFIFFVFLSRLEYNEGKNRQISRYQVYLYCATP